MPEKLRSVEDVRGWRVRGIGVDFVTTDALTAACAAEDGFDVRELPDDDEPADALAF